MKQLTEQQAIDFCDNRKYDTMTDYEKAEFQLQQERLCMPIDVFKKALSNALCRNVYTDGLLDDNLLKELREKKPR